MNNFWNISANVEIATALMLIVLLLLYIAFRLSGKDRGSSAQASKRASSR